MRRISIILIVFSIFSVSALQADSTIHNKPDTKWNLPLAYWCHVHPFHDTDSFIFLTKVTALGEDKPPISKQELPFRFREGDLQVLELLSPPVKESSVLAKVKTLHVEGTEGMKIGDRIVVMVCDELFDGLYAIKYHEGGCLVGVRLPLLSKSDVHFDENEKMQEDFLNILRKGKFNLRQLSEEEMNIWLEIDPKGIGKDLIHEIEMGRLKWQDRP